MTGPVRRIPLQTRSVSSKVASQKTGHSIRTESGLETDFALLMEFDADVRRCDAQPLTVHYDLRGKAHRYTPDFLVHFHSGRPSLLVEIKYAEQLEREQADLQPRFDAAQRHAQGLGWVFEVHTDQMVRTPYLHNVRFLLPYRRLTPNTALADSLLSVLDELQLLTPQGLLEAFTPDRTTHAEVLPYLWQLVATHRIGLDLHAPLTMHSPLWPAERSA